MDAVVGFAPELDRLGADAQGAPVLGAGRRRLLDLGQVREAVAEAVEVVDRLALAGDDRLQLVQEVALVEELLGEGALGQLASPVDVTWRPSAGQWKSSATCGLASISRALRVHNAEVKSRASSSSRFRVTVRAEGWPPAPTVTKATEAGCGIPAARASSIQRPARGSDHRSGTQRE